MVFQRIPPVSFEEIVCDSIPIELEQNVIINNQQKPQKCFFQKNKELKIQAKYLAQNDSIKHVPTFFDFISLRFGSVFCVCIRFLRFIFKCFRQRC